MYELLTGHSEREPGELVFVADLSGELRAWPNDTWAKLGVEADQAAQAVVGCWLDGEVTGLKVDDLGFEEARSLTRPAMTYVRGQLRGRLTAWLTRVHRRWLHPTSGRRPGDWFRSTVPARRTPDAAERQQVSGTRRQAGRPQWECRAGSAAGPLRVSHRRLRWPWRPDTDRPYLIEAVVACGGSGPRTASGCCAQDLPCPW